MSETLTNLNPDLAAVNAEQAAHQANFITHDRASGLGMDLAGNVSGPSETLVAETSTAETPAVEASVEVSSERPLIPTQPEALNPDRALARLGNRLSGFADRRTTKQVVAEKKDSAVTYTTEKAEATKAQAKKVATKVGVAAILSVDSALETAGKITEKVNHQRETIAAVREFNKAERTNRKEARLTARAEKRAEKTMLKEAYADNKDHDKKIKDYTKLFDKADRRDRRAENKAQRAETRAELTEKAKKTAKFAGKAALFAGVGIAAVPVGAAYGTYKGAKLGAELGMKLDQKTAELAAKGARKTIEVADDLGEAVTIKVVRGAKKATEVKTAAVDKTKEASRFVADTTMLNVRAGKYIAKDGLKNTKVNYRTRRMNKHIDKAIAQSDKIVSLNNK